MSEQQTKLGSTIYHNMVHAYGGKDVPKKKFEKFYGLFFKDTSGRIFGETENSFSTSWNSNYVRIYNQYDLPYLEDAIKRLSEKTHPDNKFFILRLTHGFRKCKDETFIFNFEDRKNILNQKYDKYHMRNVQFGIVERDEILEKPFWMKPI